MSESFVDLTYRGLALGRRAKLTQVRPSSGYVELPAPMPVGTAIGIASEDGALFEVTVIDVKEQAGGTEGPPGMTVRPRLDGDVAKKWWQSRVDLPDVVKPEAAPVIGIVRSKRSSHAGAVPELVDDGRNTAVQQAIDPDKLDVELNKDTQLIPVMDSNPAMPAIQDDGKRTIAMDAVDLAALGLDPATSSGSIPTFKDDDGEGDDDSKPSDSKSGPSSSSSARKKRRRR
ncbi:MAG: hypothetical protein ABI678_02260 [Kofleriaceae bacterium]